MHVGAALQHRVVAVRRADIADALEQLRDGVVGAGHAEQALRGQAAQRLEPPAHGRQERQPAAEMGLHHGV